MRNNLLFCTIGKLLILLLIGFSALCQGKPGPKPDPKPDPIILEKSTFSGKVTINEIHVDDKKENSSWIELYFPDDGDAVTNETMDISSWKILYEGQGNTSGSINIKDICTDNCNISEGSFLVIPIKDKLHSEFQEVLLSDNAPPSGKAVHYFRYTKENGSHGNQAKWQTSDTSFATIYTKKLSKNKNLCATTDGSIEVSKWDECEPTPGTSNDGGPPADIEPSLDYRFDECTYTGTGFEVIDQSDNDNHASITGISESANQGPINSALDLSANGVDDWVKIPKGAVNGLNNFTVSTWIKTSTSKEQQEIIHALGNDKNDDELEIAIEYDKKVYVKVRDESATLTSTISLTDGNWHHLTVTRVSTKVCLYVDSSTQQCRSEGDGVNSGELSVTNVDAVVMGQEQDKFGEDFSSAQNFVGLLDEFKIFQQALTAAQIKAIYDNESGGQNYDNTTRETEVCDPADPESYRITGQSQLITKDGGDDKEWSWNGNKLKAWRGAMEDTDNFGEGGTVSRKIKPVDLSSSTPDLLKNELELKNVDAFVSSWWRSDESLNYHATLKAFFQAGGDLILLQDYVNYDGIGESLGINTESGMENDTTISSPLQGPFIPVSDVPVGTITIKDGSTHLVNKKITDLGGTVCGVDKQGQATFACWEKGTFKDMPNSGKLVIIVDTEFVTTGENEANYTNLNDKAALALNVLAFLISPPQEPELVADYRMDENVWSGTDHNEVNDSSGNDNHGTAINGLTTSIDPDRCRVGKFDGENDYIKNDKVGEVLRDSASMSFWIKTSQIGNNDMWNAPGISGVEQSGGINDIFWGWIDATGHIGVSVGNDSSSKSTVAINDGSFHHIVLTRDATTGSYKIYIDGSLDKSGTTGTGVISTTFNSIGRRENGNNGYFQGQLDLLKIYSGILSASHVNDLFNEARSVCVSGPDHYAITHSSPGVTCEGAEITVTAHDSSHADVNVTSDTALTVTTDPLVDSIVSSPVTIPSGSSSTTFYLHHSTALNGIDIDVTDGSASDPDDGGSEDAVFNFLDTAFRFYTDGSSTTPIGSQIAGKSSDTVPGKQTLTLRAVRTDTDGACEAALQGTTSVNIAYECNNPITCTDNSLLDMTDAPTPTPIPTPTPTSVKDNDNGETISYTGVNLTFDSRGIASFKFKYKDAGKITLHAKKVVSASSPDPAFTLTGSSNPFVVRPFGFYIEAVGNPKAENAAGTKYKKAGEEFVTNVTAKQWEEADDLDNDGIPDSKGDNDRENDSDLSLNATTPNFGQEIDPEKVVLVHTLKEPSGGSAGSLSGDPITSFTAGKGSTDLSWSEVGIIDLTANLSSTPSIYANSITGNIPFVGRFTPDHFVLSTPLGGDGVLSGGNPFVYSGQMISTDVGETVGQISYATQPKFTITALASDDSTTQNYTGAFNKLDANSIHGFVKSSNAANTLELTGELTKVGSLTAANGKMTYTFNDDDNFAYERDADARIAPFDAAIDLDIEFLKDNDTPPVSANNNLTLKPRGLPSGLKILFGRWVMQNSYGPETSDLRIPMQLQYWDGSQFISNTDDSFTAFNSSSASISENKLKPTPADNPIVSGAGLFSNGESKQLMLAPPSDGERGSVKIEFSVPAWLQYDWSNIDGLYDGPHTEDPDALATFGLYRGNDRIIYRQEVFQ